ncbi:MAG TPA: type II and III secretion system protein, partial [Edaphobacter sp.]|nr:type II and III secretion system protein [Edaphobacter sp.]
MLYSPERTSLEETAPTGSVLPCLHCGAGAHSGKRLTLFGVKDANERSMSRSKLPGLPTSSRQFGTAALALFAVMLFGGSSLHAQSAKTWD